jgi:hypothetical protein
VQAFIDPAPPARRSVCVCIFAPHSLRSG